MGSPNYTPGHAERVALVIHTMSGTLAGSDSWFQQTVDPKKRVSAHFGVGLAGDIHQYVDLANSAWANGVLEPGNVWVSHFGAAWSNGDTASIETEDLGNPTQVVTDKEYAYTLAVAKHILRLNPSIHTVATHRSISPISRPNCPGNRWWGPSQRLQQLANELGLAILL